MGDLELHNLNVAAAAQRVAAELRALGHSSVRVVCPKVSLGLGGLELDGLVLADGCAALIEVGAVLNEHTMAQLQRRLVVAGGPDAPAELRGLRLVGVLAGGVVRPDYTDVHSAQELAEEWAAAGVALLLPNAMGGLDFGDECLKSAPLLWPRPDG